MISFVRGKLLNKTPTLVTVEIGGIGLDVFVPMSTSKVLPAVNETVFLLTHLYVKEDALKLFGFADEDERELFRHLISVSGVGPKLALTILSGMSIDTLYDLIASGNETALVSVPGIGKKTAQRLIVDLKDKVASKKLARQDVRIATSNIPANVADEAILALISLGYNRVTAQKAIEKAALKISDVISVEELITRALRNM